VSDIQIDFAPYLQTLEQVDPVLWRGEVTEMVGLLVESRGPAVAVGNFCEILSRGGKVIRTQVVGFRNGRVLSIPLEETDGVQLGDTIVARAEDSRVAVGPGLLGRVLDGFGEPMDGGPPIHAEAQYELFATPPNALAREPIKRPLATGIRVIDSMLTCGEGQRIGLLAEAASARALFLAPCRGRIRRT
jgi:flagellar biosynthesis/type III secretory pathway ATPase